MGPGGNPIQIRANATEPPCLFMLVPPSCEHGEPDSNTKS